MAIYRTVSMSFWTDSKVVDDFSPEDRYFYLYLFTNPHTNLCGCYEISVKQMSVETGYNIETIYTLLKRFSTVHDIVRYSQETKELLLLNWHKYNWTTSEKFRKPLLKEIGEVKQSEFRIFLQRLADGESVRYGIDTTCIDTSVTVTDTVNNNIPSSIDTDREVDNVVVINNNTSKRESTTGRFIPPTEEEVEEYCRSRKNTVDPKAFIAFYQSKGWKVGNQGMKDWKAAVITWERKEKQNARRSGSKISQFATSDEYWDSL